MDGDGGYIKKLEHFLGGAVAVVTAAGVVIILVRDLGAGGTILYGKGAGGFGGNLHGMVREVTIIMGSMGYDTCEDGYQRNRNDEHPIAAKSGYGEGVRLHTGVV